MFKAKKLLDIESNLEHKNILQINDNQLSINAKTNNFSDERILEITKTLKDRDDYLYEHIFLSNEEDEMSEIEQKNTDRSSSSNNNQLNIKNAIAVCNDGKILNDKTALKEYTTNISNTASLKTRLINSLDDKNNESIRDSLIGVSNENYNTETSKIEFSSEDTLPNSAVCINSDNNTIIADQDNVSSNEKLLEYNNSEKYNTNGMLVNTDFENINNKATALEAVDKSISDKEPNIISKLQNMNWLKTRPSLDIISMTVTPKLTLKSLPKKNERNKDYISKLETINIKKNKSNVQNRNSNEISDSNKQNNTDQQKNMQHANVGASRTAWNSNNTTKELFPEAQSLVIGTEKEEEELSIALAESICTAQQENEKRNMCLKMEKMNSQDDYDDNYWGTVQKNLPDSISTDDTNLSKSNQNQGIGFVDKFGRVDGYSEKRLFMGKGARRKEQDLLKTHTENKSEPQNKTFLQSQTLTKNTVTEQKQNETTNENKDNIEKQPEIILPNRNQEKSVHGKSFKENNFPESDLSINSNDKKTCHNETLSKDLNQSRNDTLKSNQEHVYKTQAQMQTQIYQNQGLPSRNQEYNKYHEYGTKYQNYYDKQEYFNNQQSYIDQNYDNGHKNQDYFNRKTNYYDRNKYYYDRNTNYHDRNKNYHDRNTNYYDRNQEYYRNQNYPENFNINQTYYNRSQDYANTIQRRLNQYQKDECLENDEQAKFNTPHQKYFDSNKLDSQQAHHQRKAKPEIQEVMYPHCFEQRINFNKEEKKPNAEERTDSPVRVNVKQEKHNANSSNDGHPPNRNWKNELERSNSYRQQDKSNTSNTESRTNKTTSAGSETKSKGDTRSEAPPASTTCSTVVNVQGTVNSESKPNVVMAFEGNRNVQRALGLNPSGSGPEQSPHRAKPEDGEDRAQLAQETVPPVRKMNVNAAPFAAPGGHAMGPAACQETEPRLMPNNEISNWSHKLLGLHNTVCSLSKQLATAQANLIAAQMKFYEDTVSFSSANGHNQLPMPSQPLPLNCAPVGYQNYPGFPSPMANLKNGPPDPLELAKSFPPVNLQNFAPEPYHPMDPRLSHQPMYIPPSNVYQRHPANFQPYFVRPQQQIRGQERD